MKTSFVLVLMLIVAVPARAQPPTPIRDALARNTVPLAGGQPPPQSATPPRGWVARHPALTGALAGLAVGFPIGVATCNYPGAEGPCSAYTFPGNARMLGGLTIGGLGAGIGALAGAAISATRD